MRKATYILLSVLLLLGSVYNTGQRLGAKTLTLEQQVFHELSLHRHGHSIGASAEKFKPKQKIRYRGSEVRLDLCGAGGIVLFKPIFGTSLVFSDNYSFHTLSYQHDIKLRGPPAGYSC